MPAVHSACRMQLEFHQLDRRWEHLRVRPPARQRRLLASLAEVGQQTPIVVVAAEGQADRYVVIDGYKRLAALQQLGRDTVEAVVWPMKEAEALVNLTAPCASPSTRRRSNKAGCWRSWSSATATDGRSWRAALIAASVESRGGWPWSICCRRPSSSECARGESPPTWP